MKIFNITIWKFTEALHSCNVQFDTDSEARNYALGLYEGVRVMGGEPTGIETKEILENPMCKKYSDADSIPDEDGTCSLCGGNCCDF